MHGAEGSDGAEGSGEPPSKRSRSAPAKDVATVLEEDEESEEEERLPEEEESEEEEARERVDAVHPQPEPLTNGANDAEVWGAADMAAVAKYAKEAYDRGIAIAPIRQSSTI